MPFEPEVDGDVLPARPVDSVAAGQGADVDLLVGWNTDEHRLFLHPTGAIAAVDDALLDGVALALGLSPDAVAAYRRARPGASPGDVLAAVSTDWFFRIPAVRLAEAHVGGPGRTYMYEFAWRSPVMDGGLGGCHALELPFMFDNLEAEGAAALTGEGPPQAVADAMHGAWVAFIRDGDPGWAAYDEATGRRCASTRPAPRRRPARRRARALGRRPLTGQSSERRCSPSATCWPSATAIDATTPARGASSGNSIFIDSRISNCWPAVTSSPTVVVSFQTLPVTGEGMSVTGRSYQVSM